MAIVVAPNTGPAQGTAGGRIGNSYIAWNNLLLSPAATLSADVEDPDREIENGASWNTYGGGWQTTTPGTHSITLGFAEPVNVSSYALHKHNLGTLGVGVALQSSQDGNQWTTAAGSERNPATDVTLFVVVGGLTAAPFWRILLTGHQAGTLRVAQIFMGEAVQLYQPPAPGFTPPALALNDQYITSQSDGGDFLGRSLIRKGSRMRFSMQPVQAAWVRSVWEPFMAVAQAQPFYYAWDTQGHGEEVAYCYVDQKITHPTYTSNQFMSVSLDFVALRE